MKLGIIGSGAIVREFLPHLVRLENLEVAAIQGTPRSKDRVAELCRSGGVPHGVFSFDELRALEIDTVYVAVPNSLHFMYCKQALESGLNVIVEKPIASNDREATELKRLAEAAGLFLFEAVTTVYFRGYEKIRAWLKELGAVRMVHCNYSQYSSRYDAFRSGEVPPAFDPAKSGGALMDLNLYNLHFVMGLFGKPNSFRYYANMERGIDTSGTLVMQYPGFLATCTAAKDCNAPYSFVIEGTDGYITTQYPPNLMGAVTLHRNDKTEERFDDGMAASRMIPEFTFFIDCINRKDHNACMRRLDASVAVSEVQTKARLEAGIVFPADRQ